jgi:hypothetical protein
MNRNRLSGLIGLCAPSLAIAALSVFPTASADPPSWNGEYAITFIVGPKSGTSGVSRHWLTAWSATRPRATLARMSWAVAVHTNGLGSLLCAAR